MATKKKVYSKNALRRQETSRKLSKRKPGRKRLDAKFPQLKDAKYLETAYHSDGKSLTTIGREIDPSGGVSHGVVWAAMKRFRIKLRSRADAKRSLETKPRKRSPRTTQHTTLLQRRNLPVCPNCGAMDWYTPLKSDSFLCNACEHWYDATPAGDTVTLEEHVDGELPQ